VRTCPISWPAWDSYGNRGERIHVTRGSTPSPSELVDPAVFVRRTREGRACKRVITCMGDEKLALRDSRSTGAGMRIGAIGGIPLIDFQYRCAAGAVACSGIVKTRRRSRCSPHIEIEPRTSGPPETRRIAWRRAR